jgi:hypothetical protein
MTDDIPFDEEPHVAHLRVGLRQKNCSDELRTKLLAALQLRINGSKAANEDELLAEVDKLIGKHPF